MNVDTPAVHWTRFPTSAVSGRDGEPLDWTDQRAAHRAVFRLFSQALPGDAETKRSQAGILYRVDLLAGLPTVLVQSRIAPELIPPDARTIRVPARAWALETGDRIAFRVAVNPIKRTTRRFTDDGKKEELPLYPRLAAGGVPQKQTARVVPVDEIGAWLSEKLAPSLNDVQLLSHSRDVARSNRHKLIIDTIDATATVRDAALFEKLRLDGVGRSKAYGCGLVTATRAEPIAG